MEKWKSWAISIGAGWTLLAFIAWHYESKCGIFLTSACFKEYWGWLRYLVLLKWVYPYQTLIAGLAAIAGGAFLIWSQLMQIKEQRHKDLVKQTADIKAAISITRSEIIHIADHLLKDALKTHNPDLSFSRKNLQTIASFDARLLHITISVIHRLETAIYEKENDEASESPTIKHSWYPSIGLAFSVLLRQVIDRIENQNPINVVHGSFEGADVYEYLKGKKQTPRVLLELGPYFSWPEEYDESSLE